MKRLQRYYLFVGIPVLCIVLGTIFFFDAIANTVKGNPHPQINYIIFVLITAGCWLMIQHVTRINKEAEHFYRYRKAVRSGASKSDIEAMLDSNKHPLDVELLMQLIEELRGKSLSSVQHAAIEAELERFAARQQRRLMLSNFMSGMMVGMGLLGTFIGLLGALSEIGKLIGSFNLGAGMADPIKAVTELVERLTSPMQAMGVAFSASLFGVLGSLIMGLLLVAVRSASSDLVALVQSGTSLMLDISDDHAAHNTDPNAVTLSKALSDLAEHSPLLRELAVALDQSERRVRELTHSMTQLCAHVSQSQAASDALQAQIKQQTAQHEKTEMALLRLQENVAHLSTTQSVITASGNRVADLLQQQLDMTQHQANTQQGLWKEQTELQRTLFTQQAESLQKIVQTEHHARMKQMEDLANSQDAGLEIIARHLNTTEKMMTEHTNKFESLLRSLTQVHQENTRGNQELAQALSESSQTLKTDTQARTQLVLHLNTTLNEVKLRNEQIFHKISTHPNPEAQI
jgi:hypothetical protein